MFNLNDNKNKLQKDKWLMPSFDFTPIKTPVKLKRTTTMTINDLESPQKKSFPRKNSNDNLNKRENINSLSELLTVCNPKNSSDLAVSRQKQQEIFSWLEGKTQKGKPNILIISGPSGCGKTVALKVLAEEHGFDVTEWITPLDQLMDENSKNKNSNYSNIQWRSYRGCCRWQSPGPPNS